MSPPSPADQPVPPAQPGVPGLHVHHLDARGFDALLADLHRLPVAMPGAPATTPPPPGSRDLFHVARLDGRDAPGGDRAGARYFVLDVAHDPHAGPALRAYANACAREDAALAVALDREAREAERRAFVAAQPADNRAYPAGWGMVEIDDGGERFWYAAPTSDAALAHHLAEYDADPEDVAPPVLIAPDAVHDVGGDTEPVDAAEYALGFRDVRDHRGAFCAVRGTAAMFVRQAVTRAHRGAYDVVPLFATVY